MTDARQLREWLDQLTRLGGVASALEALVATPEAILFRHASGYRVGGEALVPGAGARFDAASLTKSWMATLALVLDRKAAREERGGVSLAAAIPGAVSGVASGSASFEALLRHRSGMPAWSPLAVRIGKRLADREVLKSFLSREREDSASRPTAGPAPPVAATSSPRADSIFPSRDAVYSDLGYILWGLLVEEVAGEGLPRLLDERVCVPLGVSPLGALADDPVPAVECRLDNGKEVELAAAQGIALGRQRSHLRGVVQDGNARALRNAGVFPAHAGLFVSADDELTLAREWLRPGRLLEPSDVIRALSGDGEYALGWARQRESGSSGPDLSSASFGHTGFTGGSVWIDPESSRIYILLAHRLSSGLDFNPYRREFHRLAAALG